MGNWLDEQLNCRQKSKEEALRHAEENLNYAVKTRTAYFFRDILKAKTNDEAICLVSEFYGFSKEDILHLEDTEIYYRTVDLDDSWWKDSGEVLICVNDKKEITVILPNSQGGYHYFDEKGKKRKVDSSFSEKKAYCFFKEFPEKSIGFLELVRFVLKFVFVSDITLALLSGIAMMILGLLLPRLVRSVSTQLSTLLDPGYFGAALVVAFCLICAQTILKSINGITGKRIIQRVAPTVANAAIIRIFSLSPQERMFNTTGDLRRAVHSLWEFCDIIARSCLSFVFSTVFVTFYIIQLAMMSGIPGWLLFFTIALQILFMVVYGYMLSISCKKRNKAVFDEQTLITGFLSGIEKIIFTDAFPQSFHKWSKIKREQLKANRDQIKYNSALESVGSLFRYFLLLVLFVTVTVKGVEYGDFTASVLIIALISSQIVNVVKDLSSALALRSVWNEVRPLLKQQTLSSNLPKATHISGGIRIENLSFGYPDSNKKIFDDFSLNIVPNEYVAIVGESGCGKSTLIKLMLGELMAQSGSIYYSGNNIAKVSRKSLMREIGCVMQQDKIISGTLRENLILSQKAVTDQDIWEALRIAHIEEEVLDMPKGLDTIFNTSMSAELSVGQAQRILIARAIVSRPKILIFDEATSALDNILQSNIKDSLDSLKCTRVVVAHRLSTVINCDRIIVIKDGDIAESGNYEELMKKEGIFAELVRRQQVS